MEVSLGDGSSLEVWDEIFQCWLEAVSGEFFIPCPDCESTKWAFFQSIGDRFAAGVTVDNHGLGGNKWLAPANIRKPGSGAEGSRVQKMIENSFFDQS